MQFGLFDTEDQLEKLSKHCIGYTQGVFDMFHIGHLNLINNAKALCQRLIVGVNSDKLVEEYKKRKTVIGQDERLAIVSNIKGVDDALLVDTLDKVVLQEKLGFDVVFIGDDWQGNLRWKETERMLGERNVQVIYLPYTKGVSSTILRLEKENIVEE